jgi:hypothetical protein
VLLLGMGVCPANAVGPQMNPLVFCGGSTSDPNVAAVWQVPLVKALAERNKDKVKLALVAMDIPISRQGVDRMEQVAGDARARGRRQAGDPARIRGRERRGSTHHLQGGELCDSYAPVSTTVAMLGAPAAARAGTAGTCTITARMPRIRCGS